MLSLVTLRNHHASNRLIMPILNLHPLLLLLWNLVQETFTSNSRNQIIKYQQFHLSHQLYSLSHYRRKEWSNRQTYLFLSIPSFRTHMG